MLENHCNWKQLGGYSTLVKPYQLDSPILSSHFNSAVSIGLDKARSGLVSETHKRRHFPPTPHCRLKCQLNSLKIPAELGARQLAYWRTG